ncbi:MAG: hypothetical protein SFY70_08660 [Bacteroidia bacterium]|nr:hypothetical protein [Bacteroidia bacterium]
MRVLTTAVVWLLCAAAVFGQGQGFGGFNLDPEQAADRVTTELQNQLGLDDAQAEQVYQVHLTFFTSAREVQGAGGDRMEKAKRFRELSETRDSQLKGILTEEQFAKYQTIQEANRERMRQRMQQNGGRRGGGGFGGGGR